MHGQVLVRRRPGLCRAQRWRRGWGFSDGGSWNPHALAMYSDMANTMMRYLPNFTILGHDPRASLGGVEPWRVPGGCAGTYSTLTRAPTSTSGTLMDGPRSPSCETLDYYGTMAQTESPARNLLYPSLIRRPSGKSSTTHCLPDSIHFA